MKQSKNTKTLATCAMMIAMGSILAIFPKFNGIWPNGGSITLCSMLPIIVVSYLYGLKWGFMASGIFAVVQIMTDLRGIAGMDVMTTFLVILLDYVIAYVMLGFGGIFKGKFKNAALELAAGTAFAIFLRFLTHLLSGYLLFSSYAEWFLTQEGFSLGNHIYATVTSTNVLTLAYSALYNGSYLVPEIVLTTIGAYIIGKSGILKKQLI